jgi:hypothetical protein
MEELAKKTCEKILNCIEDYSEEDKFMYLDGLIKELSYQRESEFESLFKIIKSGDNESNM